MSCNYFSFFVLSSFAHSSSFIINIFVLKSHIFLLFYGNNFFSNSKLGFCFSIVDIAWLLNIKIFPYRNWTYGLFSIIVYILFDLHGISFVPMVLWLLEKPSTTYRQNCKPYTNSIFQCIYAFLCLQNCSKI